MQDYQPTTANELNSPRRGGAFKIILSLVLAVFIFAGGIVVGRHSDTRSDGTAAIDYSSVNHVYDLLRSDFDGNLDQTKLLDGLKSGLVTATGDPYTVYFNPRQAKDFENELSGSFYGIGAEIGTDKQNHIVIVSPLAGYPAAKAGLKPNDVIAAVDGKSTSGMSVDSVVSELRGQAGTKVSVTIIRNSGNPKNYNFTRTKITVPSVKYSVKGQIGYLQVSQFSDDTVALAQKAVKAFQSKHVKGVILDLRGDPGGFLDDAVSISSFWLNPGQTVVQERRGTTVEDTKYATGDNPLKGLPTVVLIDGGSASASEITAGALHDNHDATLVGQKSFGKGSVQQVEKLSDGSEVKITIARWYTPDGKNIDKEGITPDVTVKITAADVKAGRDPQKAKATAILESKIH